MRLLSLALLALLSHWRRHRVQFFSIFTGLWLATALWTGVQALNSQARSDYARASAVLAGPLQAQLVPRRGERFDQALYVQLRRLGWAVTPVLEGRLRFAGEPARSVRLIGIEPLSLPPASSIAGVQPGTFDLQAFVGKPGQAWVGPDTLRQLHAGPGASARDSEGQLLPPLVLQPALAPGVIVVDIGHAQALLHAPGQLSRLLVAATPGPLPADISPYLELQPRQDDGGLQRLTDSFHLNLTALGLLAFVVGLFIAHAAIGLALEQRRGLIRNLRACGISLQTLLCALVLELGLFAVLGGLAGVASGYGLAAWLLPDVAASLRGLYGAQVAGALSLPAGWWLMGVLVSVLGALLAGLGSVLRAARLPLLALAQPQAWRLAQGPWLRRQALVAGLLLLLALGCGVLGDSLPSAFGLLAGLLLAAALLLPALLDRVLAWLARHCRRPLAQWFVADSRQQLPALSLALMALLLALAASVGVGSMTEGFRKTFVSWLDLRLSADLYVTPRDTAQGLQIAEWLGQQPSVEVVLPGWRVETQLQGWPVQVQGIVDHPVYRTRWPLLAQQKQAWQQLAAGQAVMLSEQLARRLKLQLGDRLRLLADTSPALSVVGIYADYGNPKGHMLVNAGWLRGHWPQATLTGLSVDLVGAQVSALEAALQQRFALDDSRVVEQTRLKRWSTDVFNRTFAATAALNSLTLGVAGVALFINLLTLGQTRLGQLAPLWALGVRRTHLVWLSLGQTLLLSSLTVLLAIPLGILLAWCLVAVVNVQAFGWRLPLYVFPAQLLHRLEFPRDHGVHDGFRIEWWYVTANLQDLQGRDWGAQWTLFRSALRPGPETAGWNSPNLWLGHAALTGPGGHQSGETLARGGIGQAGVQAQPFQAWINDWSLQGNSGIEHLQMVAGGDGFRYDLQLHSDQPLVLHGDQGYSEKSGKGQASYYYSQPFYRVSGEVQRDGQCIAVTGQAWLDREWSSQPLAAGQTGWDWFSLHLDSGARLMLFQVREVQGEAYRAGTWVGPQGEVVALQGAQIQLQALAWARQKNGKQVPTRWRVQVPGHGVDVQVEAVESQAWMETRFPYWEGPVRLTGSAGGRGYLEMTGY